MTIALAIERDLTPPQLAKLKGIEPEKILGWIRSGELRAVNYAQRSTGRPRWRIKLEDWRAFEESRTARPPVRSSRRPRRQAGQPREFFT